jgi:hypothetical protein
MKRTAVVVVLLQALALTGLASGSRTSTSQIAIHEQGTNPATVLSAPLRGKFTIELNADRFGPAGTTAIVPDPGATTHLHGQERIALAGEDTLTSGKGQIVLAFS